MYSFLCVVMMAGVLLAGCAVGDPNINEAESALEDGNYDAALESVERALEENPENAEAFLTRARIFEAQAEEAETPEERVQLYEQVAEARQQAAELSPDARSQVESQRQFSYIDLMQRGAERFNDAQEAQDPELFRETASFFTSARLIAPDSSDAYTNEAFALLNAGDREEVVPVLERAIETNQDTADVDLYSILSSLYLQFGQEEDALNLLDEAVQFYPENQEVQELRLNAFTAAGEMDRALDAYREQVEQNPDNAIFRYNYGSLLLNNGQYEEAAEQLERAAELNPDDGSIFFNLGAAYVNQAADRDDQISAVETEVQEEGRELTDEEDARLEELAGERRELIEQAIGPFEQAFDMMDESDENFGVVCRELYRAYVLVDRTDDAAAIESCFDELEGEQPDMGQPQGQ